MTSSRTLSLVAIALAFAAVAVNASPVSDEEIELDVVKAGPKNLIVGERQYNDKLDFQENISVSASLVGKKVILEKTFNATKGHVITQVLALDQTTDGTGATAVVTAGAPGQRSITIRFKSERFHGIYFVVQLYAKPGY